MTHTEKDLKNKKQEDIINYFSVGLFIIASLLQIHLILFGQPTKINFAALPFSIWFAVTIYLVDIKQVIETSEKKALWNIIIRSIGIIISIIVVATAILETLMLYRII